MPRHRALLFDVGFMHPAMAVASLSALEGMAKGDFPNPRGDVNNIRKGRSGNTKPCFYNHILDPAHYQFINTKRTSRSNMHQHTAIAVLTPSDVGSGICS